MERGIEEPRGRSALLAISLMMVCFVLLGCAGPGSESNGGGEETSVRRSEPRLPSAEADILGIITEAQSAPKGANGDGSEVERIGVVLIEENPNEDTGSQKDSVTVTKATRLFERQGGDLTRVGSDDLKVGQRARAWYTGPVAESYPRQATARVIVVYPPAE